MTTAPVHILVVDDNQELLDTLCIILSRHAYKVTAKNRAVDLVSEIREIQPDLIIMDKNLGWRDGCCLCAIIKKDTTLNQIPVIMLSAYHSIKETCMLAGSDTFLPKPFEMAELLQSIQFLTAVKKI